MPLITESGCADIQPARRWSPPVRMGRAAAMVVTIVATTMASIGAASAGAPAPGPRYIDEVFAAVTETNDITYGQAVNEQGQLQDLDLDLFEPTGDTAAARPVLIWAHGGGFTSGSKTSALIRREALAFARRGYVTASIGYRLGDAEDLTAVNNAVRDMRTAIRWFRANADPTGGTVDFPLGRDLRIDAERIAVGGYSAGAVMALTVGYQVDDPSPGSNQGWPSSASAAVSISGAGFGNATAEDPPAIFFHGDQDTRVQYDNGFSGFSAVETCDRARTAGLDCIFRTFPGVGHGVPGTEREPEIQAMTAHFLSCRPGAESSFTDVNGRWFEDGAGFAERHELATGFPDGSFRGEAGVTRAEAVRMLYRFAGRPPTDGLGPHGLSDVPLWVEDAVRWAVDEQIMTGFPNSTFRPRDPLSRGQMLRALHRVSGATPTGGLAPHGFSDVPAWIEGEVRWVALPREGQVLDGSSIMTGFPDGTFRDTEPVNRAQTVRALRRLAHPASAWSVTLQADPYPIACYRVGDPASI